MVIDRILASINQHIKTNSKRISYFHTYQSELYKLHYQDAEAERPQYAEEQFKKRLSHTEALLKREVRNNAGSTARLKDENLTLERIRIAIIDAKKLINGKLNESSRIAIHVAENKIEDALSKASTLSDEALKKEVLKKDLLLILKACRKTLSKLHEEALSLAYDKEESAIFDI